MTGPATGKVAMWRFGQAVEGGRGLYGFLAPMAEITAASTSWRSPITA